MPTYFRDLESALESVRRGDNWGVLVFSENYTDALYERLFGIFELKQPHPDILNSRSGFAFLGNNALLNCSSAGTKPSILSI